MCSILGKTTTIMSLAKITVKSKCHLGKNMAESIN